jgi:pimeloyl-ACP methyl ester carboxylesterase
VKSAQRAANSATVRGTWKNEYVAANGLRLHCVCAGSGELVLFLHGFPEFWYAWRGQLQEFGRERLAVAVDLPGYNLSDKPAELARYRAGAVIEDIRACAAHFSPGRPFVLVAHDWGGALAWGFALAYPQLLSRLVIINAPHPAIFARLLAGDREQQAASQYMLAFREAGAEAQLSRDGYAPLLSIVVDPLVRAGVFTEEDCAAYLEAWSRPGALTGGLNYYRASRLAPPDLRAGAPAPAMAATPPEAALTVRVATLVIWGEKDTALLARNLEGLEHFVPDLTLHRIPDGTHWVVHEYPGEVNAAIRDFLAAPAP